MSSRAKPGVPRFDLQAWKRAWPDAIALWTRYARLREPEWCMTADDAKREGLDDGIAMIRLEDHRIVVSVPTVERLGLANEALAILAHEVGHHVYAPGDLADHVRMISRVRRALPRYENMAPLVLNLWTDLLVNDRLYREREIGIDKIYRALAAESPGALWSFYLRTYECLWGLDPGSLFTPSSAAMPPDLETDAWLAARLVRSYAREFVRGSGRFAAVAYPYLAINYEQNRGIATLLDSLDPGAGAEPPDGLVMEDGDEEAESRHPARDGEKAFTPTESASARSGGQSRDPFQYGEILRVSGIVITNEDAAIRYYRERALPWLLPFPERKASRSQESLPEGLETWDPGEPLDRIDWINTLSRNPVPVPGLNLLERVEGVQPGLEPKCEPLWLDLYVDSSGSMSDPQTSVSWLTLAGAIVALSALRAGAKVQATLWSGKDDVKKTDGFVSDERSVLAALVGYFGGCTEFPLHVLRDTFEKRTVADRPAHIFCISDDGITTMLACDERGNAGAAVVAEALSKARGGGTLALNIMGDWQGDDDLTQLSRLGFDIAAVSDWASLADFARAFAKRHYEGGA